MSDKAAWLKPGFVKAMAALSNAPESLFDQEADDLLGKWSDPRRSFHNRHYLTEVLYRLDDLSTLIHEQAVLNVAAWYHGVIMKDPSAMTCRIGGALNYPAAADYAHQRLNDLGVHPQISARVGELILMLADLSAPDDDMDAKVFQDAAISFIGVPPQEYRKLCTSWRQEFCLEEDFTYLRHRRSYLKKLLSRDQLFSSPAAGEFEQVAQQNLAGDLARINALLPDCEQIVDRTKQRPNGKKKDTTNTGETVVIKAKIPRKPLPSSEVVESNGTTTRVPVAQLLQEQKNLRETRELEALQDEQNGLSSMESVADVLSTMTQMKAVRRDPFRPEKITAEQSAIRPEKERCEDGATDDSQ